MNKEARRSTNLVKLVIKNFTIDHDEITNYLGVTPSRISKKGFKSTDFPKAKPSVVNLWVLNSSSKNKYDAEEQVDELFKKIKKIKALKRLDKKIEYYISCRVEFVGDDSRPTIGLTSKQIAKLAEFGCGFDVDYYLTSSK
ncbi:hypothetical protein CIK05_06725 [Bdellovibrio sp. qaytius]|nr:hypothetical protein CIK05_06725 [Bdellovibrio sp. qaytius]